MHFQGEIFNFISSKLKRWKTKVLNKSLAEQASEFDGHLFFSSERNVISEDNNESIQVAKVLTEWHKWSKT